MKDTVFSEDCRRVAEYFDTCRFSFGEYGRFFVKPEAPNGIPGERFAHAKQKVREAGLLAASEAFAVSGASDFGHTAPDFAAALKLGIPGILARVRICKEANPSRTGFYDGVTEVWEAAIRFLRRVAKEAQNEGRTEMAEGIASQLSSAPKNLYEGLQLLLILYVLIQFGEPTNVRTLGRVDSMLSEFAACEEDNTVDSLIRDWILEVEEFRVPANIPFALGGTDVDGNSLVSPLTDRILAVFSTLTVPHVKIHFLVSENTPANTLRAALSSVRAGKNSIVFLGDETVIRSLKRIGAASADAVDYAVVGCYECGAYQEIACTCNGTVNIAKAVEYAMTGGKDTFTGEQIGLPAEREPATEEEFIAEVDRQLRHLADLSIRTVNIHESDYARQHAAPILSSLYSTPLANGKDVYTDYGARYNNSSINAIGLATAADSVFAVCKLVYRDHTLTFSELSELHRNDWTGNETLRLTVKNRFPKFGQGDAATNAAAGHLVSVLDAVINGTPNVKKGVYRLGTFSIDWRWRWGEHTGATADGRRRGEVLSQNSGATFGCAKNGATAHLSSVASVGGDLTPNGGIVDLDFHISQVRGENGLSAMETAVRTYFALGGFAVHINVLDTDVLKSAREHPENYPDLQVRLCGWNVLFSSLSDAEKTEFIRRSEVGA